MFNKIVLAHLAVILVNIIYAANYTIAKEVMPTYLLPEGFILLRVTVGLLLFWLFERLFIRATIERKDFPRLLLCGMLGVAVNQLLFFKGLNWAAPISASLISLTIPIMVLVASAILLKESITQRKIVGITLGLSGAGLLIGYGQAIDFNAQSLVGHIFLFLNATSYGFYLVIVKPLMIKYHPLVVIKWVFTFGWFMVLPFGFEQLTEVSWSTIPTDIWWAIAYVLIAVSFLTYFFNSIALSIVSPTVVSAYIYAQPIMASIIAIGFGKDELTMLKIIAYLLIFLGVFLVSYVKPSKNMELRT